MRNSQLHSAQLGEKGIAAATVVVWKFLPFSLLGGNLPHSSWWPSTKMSASKARRLQGNRAGFGPLNTKLGTKNERQGMLDADKHLMAAEYLTGTFYPTEDSPPAAMSHDQATALATAHALLGIAGLLREISTALTNRS